MRKPGVVDEALGRVLDEKYDRFEWARVELERARIELGGVIENAGLSAAARRIDRSRQWCLQVVGAARDAREGKRPKRASAVVGLVEQAQAASRDHRRIAFRYVRADGAEMERTVDAWSVVNRAGRWYLVGHDRDRQAQRTFRVSRIVGGIRDVGAGGGPPQGFSAEASVWGPLDPDSLEALEESFRRVLKEQRRSAEDETAGNVVPDGAARAEIDDVRLEIKTYEEARARFQVALDESWVAQRDLLERMNRELTEFMATLVYANKELMEMASSVTEGPSGLEQTRQSLARLVAEGEDWGSALQSIRQAMDQIESDEDKRRRLLSRLNALLEST